MKQILWLNHKLVFVLGIQLRITYIFILYSLITLYLSKKKKLFCCFIDFKTEFDTIWRAGLWQKLINSNIHGKIFKIIFSFYDNIKSCVKSGHTFSDFFHLRYWCKTGRKFIPLPFCHLFKRFRRISYGTL